MGWHIGQAYWQDLGDRVSNAKGSQDVAARFGLLEDEGVRGALAAEEG